MRLSERMKVLTSYPGIPRNYWPVKSLQSLMYQKITDWYINSSALVTSRENRLFPASTASLNGVIIWAGKVIVVR